MSSIPWGLLVGLCAVAVLSPPLASAQGSPPGEVHWPPEPQAGPQGVVDLVAPLLEDPDPVVVGHPRTEAIDVNRLDESTARITVDHMGGEETYVQDHTSREFRSGLNLQIGPEELVPSVHVIRDPFESFVQVYAPPGGFDLSATSEDEIVDEVGRRLNLSVAERAHFYVSQFRFQALDGACVERIETGCRTPASFSISRDGVEFASWWLEPRHAMKLGEEPNGTIVGPSYLAVFAFHEGGDGAPELVGLSIPLVFEVDHSQVLDPEDARERVAERLRGGGSQLVNRDGEPAPPSEAIRPPNLHFEIGDGVPFLQRVAYLWETHLLNATGEDPVHVHVLSDARSGTVESVHYNPYGQPPADGDEGFRTPLAPSVPVLVAAAVGLLAARRRPR